MTPTPPKTNPPVPEGEAELPVVFVDICRNCNVPTGDCQPEGEGYLCSCGSGNRKMAAVAFRAHSAAARPRVSNEFIRAAKALADDASVAGGPGTPGDPCWYTISEKVFDNLAAQLLQVTGKDEKDSGLEDSASASSRVQLGSGDGDRSGESDGPLFDAFCAGFEVSSAEWNGDSCKRVVGWLHPDEAGDLQPHFDRFAANNTPTPESVSGDDPLAVVMNAPVTFDPDRTAPTPEPTEGERNQLVAQWPEDGGPADVKFVSPTEGKDGGAAAEEIEISLCEGCEPLTPHELHALYSITGDHPAADEVIASARKKLSHTLMDLPEGAVSAEYKDYWVADHFAAERLDVLHLCMLVEGLAGAFLREAPDNVSRTAREMGVEQILTLARKLKSSAANPPAPTGGGDGLVAVMLTPDEIGIVELIVSGADEKKAGSSREAFESARRKLQEANGVWD